MPIVVDPNIEDDKDKAGAGAAPRETVVGGGESGTITGNAAPVAPGGASAGSGAPTRSGSWTNLQSYVSANKGADKALGQRATAATTAAGETGSKALGDFHTGAKSQIAAGTYSDPSLVGQIHTAPASVDPSRYRAATTAAYTGPKAASEVKGYGETQKAVEGAGTLADQLAGSHSDRAAALARPEVAGRPSYSQGERNLDSFLLGAGPDGRAAVDQAKARYGSGSELQGAWSVVPSWFGQHQGAAQKSVDDLRRNAQGAYGEEIGKVGAAVTAATPRMERQNTADQALLDKFTSGDAAAWGERGIDAATLATLQEMGVDPTTLLDVGRQRSLGDVVDPAVQAQYAALTKMAGDTPAFDFSHPDGNVGVGVKEGQVINARDAARLYGDIGTTLGKGQDAALAHSDPKAWLQSQGLDPAALLKQGVDLSKLVQFSGVTNEAALTPAKVGSWNTLAQMLGIEHPLDPAGQAYETAQLTPYAKALLAPPQPVVSKAAAPTKSTPASAGAGHDDNPLLKTMWPK